MGNRGLLTKSQKEIFGGEREKVSTQRLHNERSKARKQAEQVVEDMRLLEENEPDLYDEIEEMFREVIQTDEVVEELRELRDDIVEAVDDE